jgi:hypothetical protein
MTFLVLQSVPHYTRGGRKEWGLCPGVRAGRLSSERAAGPGPAARFQPDAVNLKDFLLRE